jgi:membrane protease YdiL (CAAX protease family)
VSTRAAALALTKPPDPPELPAAVRPLWPAWSGFAAMGAGTVLVVVASFPLLPVALSSVVDGPLGQLALLVLILVQDAAYVGAAVGFAWLRGRPRAWQFGLRSTPLWRTAAVALLITLGVLGFEIGFVELADVDEGGTDVLGTDEGTVAAIAFSLAAIVVAPVAEELFFRAFLYRALRNRLRVWSAAAINAAVFSSVHLQYVAEPEIFVIIAVFAVGACLLYEITGSVFAPIAMHATFNTLATAGTDAGYVVPIAVGVAVVAACVVAPVRLGRAPSPFPPLARA